MRKKPHHLNSFVVSTASPLRLHREKNTSLSKSMKQNSTAWYLDSLSALVEYNTTAFFGYPPLGLGSYDYRVGAPLKKSWGMNLQVHLNSPRVTGPFPESRGHCCCKARGRGGCRLRLPSP